MGLAAVCKGISIQPSCRAGNNKAADSSMDQTGLEKDFEPMNVETLIPRYHFDCH